MSNVRLGIQLRGVAVGCGHGRSSRGLPDHATLTGDGRVACGSRQSDVVGHGQGASDESPLTDRVSDPLRWQMA